MSGLRLAALFGVYPHKLGFCGSQAQKDKNIIFNWLSGKKVPESTIKKLLQGFEGAFPYYKLIAKANSIKDPFNEKVVKAYWIGNEFLENVSHTDLENLVHNEFTKKDIKIPKTSVAHHSFHVLVVGSVTGRIELKDNLLDLCKISCSVVIEKKDNGNVLVNGKKKEVFWNKKIVPNIEIGDTMALHWNNIVMPISKQDITQLDKFTNITINSLKQ